MNKNVFLSDVDALVTCKNNKDEEGCKKALQKLVGNTPYLYEIHENIINDPNTTSNQLCTIAKALTIVHEYTANDESKTEVAEIILACFARAFILCPFKDRHIIAYYLNAFIEDTYFSHYIDKLSCTEYSSHISYYFMDVYIEDSDFQKCFTPHMYNTSGGTIMCYLQRTAKLIQWFILCHLKNLNEIRPGIIQIDLKEIQCKIDECYEHLCNLDRKKLKMFAIRLISYLFEDFSDEGLELYFGGENCRYEYNDNNMIEIHDERVEAEVEAEELYNEYLESQQDAFYEEYEQEGFGKYRGSYAQDVMGYSDDDIDTIFDGDPDAYWNID